MRVRIQVIVESEAGAPPVVQEVATLERGPLQAGGLGLTLAEAKGLLRGVQEAMVARQAAEFVAQQEVCPECGKARPRKGRHEIVYRTLFGKLRLDSPRLYECPCRGPARASASPLAARLPERTAPELAYLEAKFAALVSYGLTVDLLTEILPLGAELSTTAVRRQVRAVTERAEGELGAEGVSQSSDQECPLRNTLLSGRALQRPLRASSPPGSPAAFSCDNDGYRRNPHLVTQSFRWKTRH